MYSGGSNCTNYRYQHSTGTVLCNSRAIFARHAHQQYLGHPSTYKAINWHEPTHAQTLLKALLLESERKFEKYLPTFFQFCFEKWSPVVEAKISFHLQYSVLLGCAYWLQGITGFHKCYSISFAHSCQ